MDEFFIYVLLLLLLSWIDLIISLFCFRSHFFPTRIARVLLVCCLWRASTTSSPGLFPCWFSYFFIPNISLLSLANQTILWKSGVSGATASQKAFFLNIFLQCSTFLNVCLLMGWEYNTLWQTAYNILIDLLLLIQKCILLIIRGNPILVFLVSYVLFNPLNLFSISVRRSWSCRSFTKFSKQPSDYNLISKLSRNTAFFPYCPRNSCDRNYSDLKPMGFDELWHCR